MVEPSGQNSQSPAHFIHIIESPSAADLYDLRTEGRVLWETLNVAGHKVRYRLASNKKLFERSLAQDLVEAAKQFQATPIIHISAHGDRDGIVLLDQTRITWAELRSLLLPINHVLSNELILVMSSCFGASGCRMAMYENEPLPFHAIVGHMDTISWADAAIGFATFYHRLLKGASFNDARAAMCQAAGNDDFLVQFGKEAHDGFARYAQQQRDQEQAEQLALVLALLPQEPPAGAAPTAEAGPA